MKLLTPLLAALLFASVQSSGAELFKCQTAGSVTWQDRPCDGNSKPVAVAPANSSVSKATPADYRTQAKQLAEREVARQREKETADRQFEAFNERCRAIREEIERERAWLLSVSEVVRASAAIKIEQLQQRYYDAGC